MQFGCLRTLRIEIFLGHWGVGLVDMVEGRGLLFGVVVAGAGEVLEERSEGLWLLLEDDVSCEVEDECFDGAFFEFVEFFFQLHILLLVEFQCLGR